MARFIPAPAGNISSRCPLTCTRSVHPRACGEHWRASEWENSECGSSPRLRGTCGRDDYQLRRYRFIPAPAGNIRARCCPKAAAPVHPRACGEHSTAWRLAAPLGGSSPRLRGTCEGDRVVKRDERFIPAPAGNIVALARAVYGVAVHPRACGEHASRVGGGDLLPGSSPRLRGTYPERR